MYSIFSLVAIAIHLMVNFDLLVGRGRATAHGARYRGFLLGVLAYYVADGAWGVFAGLGWTRCLYVDSVLFFLANAVFAFMWCRFVVVYLGLGRWTARALSGIGCALLAANVLLLAANAFNGCVFSFDAQGKYLCGVARDPLFYLLIAFNLLISLVVLAKTVFGRDSARSRNMMVFVFGITMTAALVLQVVWPLTPFTALGCLIGNCFFNVFVVRDEQQARHLVKLEKALERARMAEKSRSLFFSIVSHDIRTPLNAILGYSELLQQGIDSPEERAEALKAIRASGTTLLQLVNDVLDFAKMDSGKMTLRPEPMRLDRLTDEVFASFRLAAGRKGIVLVNRTASVPAVALDRHRMRQILFNLVGNAVKFTARGSVTVAASYVGTDLAVSVADTGRGIAPDMLQHIFKPFFQVQDPVHSAYADVGSGLGLPICRRFVEMMGGELAVESAPGKGSTFTIRIPGVAVAATGGGSADDGLGPDEAGSRKPEVLPKRLLVVDDSPVNRSVLKAFLRRAGVAAVDYAGDGGEALAKIDAAVESGRPYDFVFSDFWMPKLNGLELVERLRADSRFRRLPVFAVTADTEIRNDSRAELFTGILLKPMTYDKLIEAFAAAQRSC